MTETKTTTPEDPAPIRPKALVRPGPSGLTYVNFFLSLVALVGLAGILLDPGYLVPDNLEGRLDGVIQATTRHTLDLDAVRARLDDLEQGGNLRALLEQAQLDEVVWTLRHMASQTKDPEREAALKGALQALGQTP